MMTRTSRAVDTMTAKEAIRVREANGLAKFLGELLKEAEKQGIMVIVGKSSAEPLVEVMVRV